MIKTKNKEIVINSDDLLECLYNGILPKNIVCDSDLHHELHDKYTQLKNVYGLIVNTESTLNMEDFDKLNQSNWYMPDTFKKIGDVELLQVIHGLDYDSDSDTKARIEYEFNVFRNRNLLNVLRFLLYFVTTCRDNNIVLGVGRGSSVSSYILYLIGIHKVNSIKYNLDFSEFLKE